MHKIINRAVICCCVLLSGCATLFTAKINTLRIESDPPGATIKDAEGHENGTAPYEFKPEQGKTYSFVVSKEGYENYKIDIKPKPDDFALFGDALLLCLPCIVDLPSKAYLTYPKSKYVADMTRSRQSSEEKESHSGRQLTGSRVYINVLPPDIKLNNKDVLGKVNNSDSKYNSDKPLSFIGSPESRADDICSEFKNYSIYPLQCGINKFTPDESMRRVVPEKQLNLKMSVDKFTYDLKHKSERYDGSGQMETTWKLLDPSQEMKVVMEKSATVTAQFNGNQIRYLFSDLLRKSVDEYIVTNKVADFISSKELTSAELLKGEEIQIRNRVAPKFEKTKDLINYCIKAVVTIKTDKGFGSGAVISSDGFIVTNEHVVENNKEVTVKFNNGFSLKGTVVKKNASADLALVKVDASDLTPLSLLNSEAEIGEDVFAIGTPADISLEQTVSKGIVSGKRVIEGLKFLQTDVSINPGNSGGPLINQSGEIVGINAMKIIAQGFEGLGFAIPSADVIKMLNLVIK